MLCAYCASGRESNIHLPAEVCEPCQAPGEHHDFVSPPPKPVCGICLAATTFEEAEEGHRRLAAEEEAAETRQSVYPT